MHTGRLTERPTNLPTDRLADEATDRLTEPTNQPTDRPTDRPRDRPNVCTIFMHPGTWHAVVLTVTFPHRGVLGVEVDDDILLALERCQGHFSAVLITHRERRRVRADLQ